MSQSKMKHLVFSDLHGSMKGLSLLRRAILKHKPDVVLNLGDILYGAYDGDTNECVRYLTGISSYSLAVRGNCDWDSDGARIDTPLPEERILYAFGHRLLLTHVPQWGRYEAGDIVINGHTHVKALYEDEGVIRLNPGSIGKPRDGSYSYALIDESGITLIDAEEETVIKELLF